VRGEQEGLVRGRRTQEGTPERGAKQDRAGKSPAPAGHRGPRLPGHALLLSRPGRPLQALSRPPPQHPIQPQPQTQFQGQQRTQLQGQQQQQQQQQQLTQAQPQQQQRPVAECAPALRRLQVPQSSQGRGASGEATAADRDRSQGWLLGPGVYAVSPSRESTPGAPPADTWRLSWFVPARPGGPHAPEAAVAPGAVLLQAPMVSGRCPRPMQAQQVRRTVSRAMPPVYQGPWEGLGARGRLGVRQGQRGGSVGQWSCWGL